MIQTYVERASRKILGKDLKKPLQSDLYEIFDRKKENSSFRLNVFQLLGQDMSKGNILRTILIPITGDGWGGTRCFVLEYRLFNLKTG